MILPSGPQEPATISPAPQPAWFELVDDELDRRQTRAPRHSVGLNFTPAWHGMLADAAAGRGLSMAAYARRAIMAFVCRDLGLDYDSVMRDEPPMRGYGDISVRGNSRRFGQGFGLWIIERWKGE